MGLQDLLSCSEDSVNSERSGSSNGLHDLLSYSVDSVKFENTQRLVKNLSWAKKMKLWGLAKRNSSPQAYRQVFFAKRCTLFGQIWSPQPCLWFTDAYRGSPPCTIFPTSSREHRNIVQLCTRGTPLPPLRKKSAK